MKKILLIFGVLLIMAGFGACIGNRAFSKEGAGLEILTLFDSPSNTENKLWVGTFQLAFNEMKNNIIKKDVIFENEPETFELKGLNREEFNSDMLDSASYYISSGKTSPKAKKEIEKGIYEKFKEKSDILDSLDWREAKGSYYSYAMLKKDFEFLEEFDKLEKAPFNDSREVFEFFGIKEDSKNKLDNNVRVLFYNGENDYAVRLFTKTGDEVYLYRTESNKPLKAIYDKMIGDSKKFEGVRNFTKKDTLMVPNLKVDSKRFYPELCNKVIKGTDFYFSEAIETIKLEMDNKGARVKSEAAIMMRTCALLPVSEEIRHFNFDKTFVMFLIDKGKDAPYLALRVKNLKTLLEAR